MEIYIIKKKINLVIILVLLYELFYSIKNKERTFNNFLNLDDSQNSVLIALYETDHLECLPGFIKPIGKIGMKCSFCQSNNPLLKIQHN